MLQLLHIENIAIIECADIAFRPGFNALTGETGAGKSIVIDSISAVLGQRTSRDLIRTGADMAFVSACFTDIPPRLGEDLGIAWEGELLLQREIHGDGKNVCRVNGRPVTVTQLRTLGSRLLNIHGQHDGQQLLDEEQHLLYLDSFGRTEQLLAEYREKYQAMAALRRQMQALAENGMDQVRFLMSANVGEELRPIHKIASGGELARIMLAMKNVLSEQDQVGTMVFDEVDTGVSGRAAQKVAEKMARISRTKQVLCVTHLPQLAAMADTHFSVEKGEQGGRTFTRVVQLDRARRQQELARLTGGASISATMLEGAGELLDQAEKFKKTLA